MYKCIPFCLWIQVIFVECIQMILKLDFLNFWSRYKIFTSRIFSCLLYSFHQRILKFDNWTAAYHGRIGLLGFTPDCTGVNLGMVSFVLGGDVLFLEWSIPHRGIEFHRDLDHLQTCHITSKLELYCLPIRNRLSLVKTVHNFRFKKQTF